jgi:excisionase family DNA binding protein
MKDREIMEAREVADYLHLHIFTVHKLAREGRIPGFKIGNDWRFRRSAMECWIENQEKANLKKNARQ